MADILVECHKPDLEFMLNSLTNFLPQHIQQYNFIYNYLYHYDKINNHRDSIYSDKWNIRCFMPRNGKRNNCTVVSVHGERDYIIICFTLEESKSELKECLQKTNFINWNNKPFGMLSDEKVYDVLNEVSHQKLSIDWLCPTVENVMHITKEKIEKLPIDVTLPDNFFVAPLDHMKHADIVNDFWPYKSEDSLNFVRQSIEFNGGMGIFRHGEDQPICWIVTNVYFAPGFLFTVEGERKKGYAKLIMTLELQRIRKMHGLDICAFVNVLNEPSMALLSNLGFKAISKIKWVIKPE